MASAASHRDADIAMKAMAIGAVDFVRNRVAGPAPVLHVNSLQSQASRGCKAETMAPRKRRARSNLAPAPRVRRRERNQAVARHHRHRFLDRRSAGTGGSSEDLDPPVRSRFWSRSISGELHRAARRTHDATWAPGKRGPRRRHPGTGHIYIAPGGKHLVVEARAAEPHHPSRRFGRRKTPKALSTHAAQPVALCKERLRGDFDRYGMRRAQGLRGRREGGRFSAGSRRRCLGHARAVAQATSQRNSAAVIGRHRVRFRRGQMNWVEFDYLKQFLHERSGLVVTLEKGYLSGA